MIPSLAPLLASWCLALAGRADAAEVDGANVTAMGGTANAAPDDNAAVTSNPGVLGLTERYDFAGMFRYGPGGDTEWGASVMDARTTPSVAFGVAYVGGLTSPPLETADLPGWKLEDEVLSPFRRDHQLTAAIGMPLLDRRLSFGVSGDLLLYNRDIGGSGTSGNLNAGMGVRPVEPLVVAIGARNLVPLTGPADDALIVGGGVRLLDEEVGILAADVDWRPGDGAIGWGAGAQGNLAKVRARAGFQVVPGTGEQRVTWGLGAVIDGAAFEYAMAIPVGGDVDGAGVTHAVSLRFAAPDIDKERPSDF